jgi:hypothetical protein
VEEGTFLALDELNMYNRFYSRRIAGACRFLTKAGISNCVEQKMEEKRSSLTHNSVTLSKEGWSMDTRTGQSKGSDLVLEFFHAIEEKDFDRAAKCLSNDFRFSGPTPKPVDSKECIDVHRHLVTAIPDWRFNYKPIKEDQNEVVGKVHITGTHTRELTLPMIQNLGPVQPTGKRISMPEETVHATIKGNKISRFHVDVPPNGGIMGLLSSIGVDAHAHV